MKLNTTGLAIACSIFLVSCGGGGGDKPATQVAAKVNGDEISVHQINNAMARSGATSPEQAKAASGQILERLIEQQLMIQKATESKLDREAAIVTAIENSRRQILAQAYMERTAATIDKPTPEEISKYYVEHPQLFAQRRVYRFQEFVAAVSPEQLKELQAQLDKTRNLNDVANWMKSRNIPFSGNFSIRSAEQLPMDQLPRFQKMKTGEIAVFPAQNRVLVTQLAAVQEAPLSQKEATPFIEKYFLNQRRTERAAEEIKKLRASAKVEYVGAFAENRAGAGVETAPAKPAAKADAASDGTKADANAIEKGLTGLIK